MPGWFDWNVFANELKSLSRVSELLDATELRGLSIDSEKLRGLYIAVDKFSVDVVIVAKSVLWCITPVVKLFERRVFTAIWSLRIGK